MPQIKPLTPPTVESTWPPVSQAPKKIPAPTTPQATKTPKGMGIHPKENPGATVYDGKTAGTMIRVSKILTRFTDLVVEEDSPGDSWLLSSPGNRDQAASHA